MFSLFLKNELTFNQKSNPSFVVRGLLRHQNKANPILPEANPIG